MQLGSRVGSGRRVRGAPSCGLVLALLTALGGCARSQLERAREFDAGELPFDVKAAVPGVTKFDEADAGPADSSDPAIVAPTEQDPTDVAPTPPVVTNPVPTAVPSTSATEIVDPPDAEAPPPLPTEPPPVDCDLALSGLCAGAEPGATFCAGSKGIRCAIDKAGCLIEEVEPMATCSALEVDCSDGIDDDEDMLIDCDDADCAADMACAPTSCPSAVDDNGDGRRDCLDPSCGCKEVCDDGADNDEDGSTDCADDECALTRLCEQCPDTDVDLGSVTGLEVAAGDLSRASANILAQCINEPRTPDIAYAWKAPDDGCYQVDMLGSNFDTVLHVHNPCPNFDELVCNDDLNGGASGVAFEAVRDQSYVLVVDSYSQEAGQYVLNVRKCEDVCGGPYCDDEACYAVGTCFMCPEVTEDLGSETGTTLATGTTADAENVTAGNCGGSSAPDETYSWTAPSDGCFDVRLDSDFDAVLHVHEPCPGFADLGCNDDYSLVSALGYNSLVSFVADAAQTYSIVVDGFGSDGGRYNLSVLECVEDCTNDLDDDLDELVDCDDPDCESVACAPEICDNDLDDNANGATDCQDASCFFQEPCFDCPEARSDLGAVLGDRVASGTTRDAGGALQSDCGGEGVDEVVLSWTAPADGCVQLDTSGSDFDTVLHVHGACPDFSELVCNDDAFDSASMVELTVTSGTAYLIVIDGFSDTGDYVLNINACE